MHVAPDRPQRAAVEMGDVPAQERDASTARDEQAEDATPDGRLATAALPHEGPGLACAKGQGHAVDRPHDPSRARRATADGEAHLESRDVQHGRVAQGRADLVMSRPDPSPGGSRPLHGPARAEPSTGSCDRQVSSAWPQRGAKEHALAGPHIVGTTPGISASPVRGRIVEGSPDRGEQPSV